ncbi:CoA-binding protein [Arenimonas terrae]|uniref:CoA-binding protein n=1 Tax=Arenimonas terrae TaxID=2546226 RepID=A0A5C4RTU8_9GAMM|nr:CoA-binding protein [Arenimonas terrae]TNJ34743.1 CoA-binding protein [Arenimonas terrae]
MSARGRLIESDADLRALLSRVRRIAVLGIKTEAQRGQPAIEIPRYLERVGFDVIPVPVYYPEVEQILRRPVFRRLADIPGDVDLVDVFRRPKDLAPHLDDILAKRPGAVWLQEGIRDDAFAEALLAAGIDVVQDRCLMVEHRRLAAG